MRWMGAMCYDPTLDVWVIMTWINRTTGLYVDGLASGETAILNMSLSSHASRMRR